MPFKLPTFLLNRTPEEIVEWFEQKGNTISWNWSDVWQRQHAQTFTVAKALKLDILQDIRNEMQQAIDNGETFDQFQRNLAYKLKRAGWWGRVQAQDVPGYDPASGVDPEELVQLGSPWRLQTIFNTNMNTAYATGRYRQQRRAAHTHPYWQYLAILDDRTRDEHAALHKKVFRYDDPFWEHFYPPNGWGCRCRVRALSQRQLDRLELTVQQTGPNNFGIDTLLDPDTGRPDKVAWFGVDGQKVQPERGWSYNPGAATWKPDLSQYDKDLVRQFRADQP